MFFFWALIINLPKKSWYLIPCKLCTHFMRTSMKKTNHRSKSNDNLLWFWTVIIDREQHLYSANRTIHIYFGHKSVISQIIRMPKWEQHIVCFPTHWTPLIIDTEIQRNHLTKAIAQIALLSFQFMIFWFQALIWAFRNHCSDSDAKFGQK